jgi:hypothetical protein
MGSLPEERSKVIGVSLSTAQKLMVRPPVSISRWTNHQPDQSDCQLLEQRPWALFQIHVDVFV